MSHSWTKPYKKIEHVGSITINNEWIGEDLNEKTQGIVVESVTRETKKQIKLIRTNNINFFLGSNTIAVFRIKERSITVLNAKVP